MYVYGYGHTCVYVQVNFMPDTYIHHICIYLYTQTNRYACIYNVYEHVWYVSIQVSQNLCMCIFELAPLFSRKTRAMIK